MEVEIACSGIWQLSSVLLSVDGACLMVDPGYFPRELDDLVRASGRHGEVVGVVFTHGHWDHVVGWQRFPAAPVFGSVALAEAVNADTEAARSNLAHARDFDGRWYVERTPPLAWPKAIHPLGEGARLPFGGLAAHALLLPGHSTDGVALHLPTAGLLLVGDYLSPCEIPFVEDLPAYRATLRRLIALCADLDSVIPGHGPRLSSAQARTIAEEDLRYLDALADAALRKDTNGALAIPLPRAALVPGMFEHHIENCQHAGLVGATSGAGAGD